LNFTRHYDEAVGEAVGQGGIVSDYGDAAGHARRIPISSDAEISVGVRDCSARLGSVPPSIAPAAGNIAHLNFEPLIIRIGIFIVFLPLLIGAFQR
jgi:hypothetical protein